MQGPTCTTVHGPCPSERRDGAQEHSEHYLWFLEEEGTLLTTICDPGKQRSSTLGAELTSQVPQPGHFKPDQGPDSASCPGLLAWAANSAPQFMYREGKAAVRPHTYIHTRGWRLPWPVLTQDEGVRAGSAFCCVPGSSRAHSSGHCSFRRAHFL